MEMGYCSPYTRVAPSQSLASILAILLDLIQANGRSACP
jgi:hypothetical protein